MSLKGHPVTIITLDDEEKLHLDLAALESVLNQPELKDRPVCLLPIAGTFCLFTISAMKCSHPIRTPTHPISYLIHF